MNLFKGDHKKEWYKKINPAMKIPAIKDGEHVMGESLDIAKYLIRNRRIKTPFYPTDDPEKIDQIDKDCDLATELSEATRAVAFNLYFGPIIGQKVASKEECQQFLGNLGKKYDGIEAFLEARGTKFLNSDSKRVV